MQLTEIKTYTDPTQTLTLVRVTMEDGAIGWGQLAPWQSHVSAMVLHHQVAWWVLWQDVNTPKDLQGLADRVLRGNHKFLGSHLWRAYAGVDLALWDMLGRRAGKPVAELLDPQQRHGGLRPLRAYASSMRRDITAEDEAERLKRLRDEQGFEAFKVRVAQVNGRDSDAAPGRSEAVVSTCRRVLGHDATLMADANGGYSPPHAIAMGRRLEDLGYAHFEEPCAWWELEQTAEVADALDIDVAGGEQDSDPAQFRRMLGMNAVDLIQPDVCYVGGLTRALQVSREAERHGTPVIPHSANRTLVLPASIHLMCAVPNAGPYVEVGIDDVEAFCGVFDQSVEIEAGLAHPPVGPGWGVTPRPDWLARASVAVC